MKEIRLSHEDVGELCLALFHLYHAGIGAGDALALLAEDHAVPAVGELLSQMSARADEGQPLGRVFCAAGCFPAYVYGLLDVGEQMGRTEEALGALAAYYQGRARMARRLKAALLYPSILLCVMLAVVVILLVWVLPVFNDVYTQLGSRLTGVAGGLLAMGRALRGALPALCVVLAAVAVFAALTAALPGLRDRLLDRWKRARGDRGLARMIYTARFAQALAMGMSSGCSDREAVELATGLSDDVPAFRLRCQDCLARLDGGETLASALRETGLLSRAESRLLEAGMRGGAGETAMGQIAQRLLEESEESLEGLAAAVEPTLVTVMSVLVGIILLTVMLPLMHIMTSIG